MPLPSGHADRYSKYGTPSSPPGGRGGGGDGGSQRHGRDTPSRKGSWDVLAGIRKFEHSYGEFDSRNASKDHLAFAEGDIPKNGVSFYFIIIIIYTVSLMFIAYSS